MVLVTDILSATSARNYFLDFIIERGTKRGGRSCTKKGVTGGEREGAGGGRVALGRVKQEGCINGIYFLLHR